MVSIVGLNPGVLWTDKDGSSVRRAKMIRSGRDTAMKRGDNGSTESRLRANWQEAVSWDERCRDMVWHQTRYAHKS